MEELMISRNEIINELKICRMRLRKLKSLIKESGYEYGSNDYLTQAIENIEKETKEWDDDLGE